MIKKIDIMGLQLDNYTVREAILQAEPYLSNNVLNTMESISMQTLIAAEQDPIVQEVIASLDLTVIGEKEILQAAGAATMQRMKETEANDFSVEFLKRLERNRKRVFLLSETRERLACAGDKLQKRFPKLEIVGEYAVENCVGNLEAVINDMNATTPDVIISLLPTPMQEHFLSDHRDKISANIWYGAGDLGICGRKTGIISFLRSRLHLGKLRNSMNKYSNRGAVSDVESEEDVMR